MELLDSFFHGIGADQFVHEDGFGLADAVSAVGGLGFGGGVPPGIIVDDGVRRGEIETGAAGFEGNEEEGDLAILELLHQGAAILG